MYAMTTRGTEAYAVSVRSKIRLCDDPTVAYPSNDGRTGCRTIIVFVMRHPTGRRKWYCTIWHM